MNYICKQNSIFKRFYLLHTFLYLCGKYSIVEPKIKIEDFNYALPEERIAKYPLEKRDRSKLLIFKDGRISEDKFYNLAEILPSNSLMVFNNTKVVPARMMFRKTSGAAIEIFCLEPHSPSDYNLSFASKGECEWSVVIGNAKKWKEGPLFFFSNGMADAEKLNLRAELVRKNESMASIVRFLWDTDASFSEVLDICGRIPIPPYLKRETESIDLERYQTLYARIKGSVAAPTAGLHFTDNVLKEIDSKGIVRMNLCLHVGAGTFMPVKSEYISGHKMHTEPFSVTVEFVELLYNALGNKKIIAVGTTSARSLESLYYCGVHCLEHGDPSSVSQWEPYGELRNHDAKEAVGALLDYMKNNGLQQFKARTSIIIVPSYSFRIIDILVTNFHQPQSTLLLLISAFTGGERWRDIYSYALGHGFRFLSYGDSSVLFR